MWAQHVQLYGGSFIDGDLITVSCLYSRLVPRIELAGLGLRLNWSCLGADWPDQHLNHLSPLETTQSNTTGPRVIEQRLLDGGGHPRCQSCQPR